MSTFAFIIPYIRSLCPRFIEDQSESGDGRAVTPTTTTAVAAAFSEEPEPETEAAVFDLMESHLYHPKKEAARRLAFETQILKSETTTTTTEDAIKAEAIADATADRTLGSVDGMSKEALIIGINYIRQRSELSGCINDAHNMRDYLSECCGLDSYLLMTDKTRIQPKRDYILKAIRYMISRTGKQGGTFFMHYSGHGSQQRSYDGDNESDGMDETLVPVDYARAGQITDDQMHNMVVDELAKSDKNVRCILVLDMCHSGTAVDLAHSYDVVDGSICHRPIRASSKDANVVMISGCRDSQTSSDVRQGGTAFGALSDTLIRVLRRNNNGRLTWGQLLLQVNTGLAGFTQVSQLSSEQELNLDEQINW